MQQVYYCVLKNYKGLFKKKHIGNTYILIVPLPTSDYLILGLVGELNQEDTYSSVLVYKVPDDTIEDLIMLQTEDFKWRFEVIEKIECLSRRVSDTSYFIDIKEKGSFIKSDINLSYDSENSSDPLRIYIVQGKLVFPSSYIITPETDMRMIAIKKKTVIKVILQNIASLFKRSKTDVK